MTKDMITRISLLLLVAINLLLLLRTSTTQIDEEFISISIDDDEGANDLPTKKLNRALNQNADSEEANDLPLINFEQALNQNAAVFENFKRGQCRAHSCRPDPHRSSIQKISTLQFKSNGCRYFGGGSSNHGFEEDLLPCCHMWNACQQICGVTKGFCDETMRQCLSRKCVDADELVRKTGSSCRATIGTYMMSLKISQCEQFEAAQEWGCECVDKESIVEKRTDVLKEFYTLYHPEELSEVDALRENATDKQKFAILFHVLVSKYPASIKQRGDTDSNNKEL